MTPNKWEIWTARVKFEDDLSTVKERPVLVLGSGEACIISLKITSHPPRLGYWGELSVEKWSEAGLTKPSTIRASKKLMLIESDFVIKLGRLHPVDIKKVIDLFSKPAKKE